MEQLIRLFPVHLREVVRTSNIFNQQLEEIRVRVNAPLMFRTAKGEFFLREKTLTQKLDNQCLIMSAEDVHQMSVYMSKYSLYAYEEEIKKGFLTVEGGHRVGVCGQAACENGQIRRMHPISYLNIRVAQEQKNCAKDIFPYLLKGQEFCNTLLLSAPGVGKTTLLRDIIRLLSDGSESCPGKKVGLVDERSEIAGCLRGIPQNDVGIRTDVLDACPKAEGMMLFIRSMSPEILAVDEIGGTEDMNAMQYAMRCGCRIVATIHSRDIEELASKPGWGTYLQTGLFERYIVLFCENGVRRYAVYSGGLKRIC
ncbi:MAG: stage III sporulation protein AA [Lachnospiraceae bacterium]|nr:stage III sporulation protein AA [Lachnospiraceae bacterium]